MIAWLEAHERLSGWAQFFGAMVTLAVTYLTVFAPHWARRRQLRKVASRLLLNGYEVLESYHRTSAYFVPTSISVRAAALTMMAVADEIDRFPVFELSDQGPRSTARHLITVCRQLKLIDLAIGPIADDLDSREGTVEDQEMLRSLVGDQMELIRAIITGKELKRPEWPDLI